MRILPRLLALDVHNAEPTEPDQMCDTARIIAICLVAHGAETGLHVPTLETKRWKAGRSQLS